MNTDTEPAGEARGRAPGASGACRLRRRVLHVAAACGALVLGGCSASRWLSALTPDGGGERIAAIPYGDDPRHRLDVYRPAPDAARGPGSGSGAGRPVVVFFPGGSWNSGEREDYCFVGQALAARGVVAVVVDYRLFPQVRYPGFLHDCARAVAWVRREIAAFGGDPAKLFVTGHSAGAYNAAMLALDARWLAAQGQSPAILAGWIGLAGPYDFLPIRNPQVKPVFDHPDYPPRSQPIEHVTPASPPAFIAAAETDSLVDPRRNSAQMAALLESSNVRTVHREYPGVDHVTLIGAVALPLRWMAPVLDDVVRFVDGA